MNDKMINKYKRWCVKAIDDADLVNELKSIENNEEKIEDAFYRDL